MEAMTWQQILLLVIAVTTWLGGAPIIQLIKNGLGILFKRPVQDVWAIFLTLLLSGGLAVLEMFLTGQFTDVQFTLANFPAFFAGVYGMSQLYWSALKNSTGALGRGALLKETEATTSP